MILARNECKVLSPFFHKYDKVACDIFYVYICNIFGNNLRKALRVARIRSAKRLQVNPLLTAVKAYLGLT